MHQKFIATHPSFWDWRFGYLSRGFLGYLSRGFFEDGKDASSLLLTVADADVGLPNRRWTDLEPSALPILGHLVSFVVIILSLFYLIFFHPKNLRLRMWVRCYSIPDTSITSQRTTWGFATREAWWTDAVMCCSGWSVGKSTEGKIGRCSGYELAI